MATVSPKKRSVRNYRKSQKLSSEEKLLLVSSVAEAATEGSASAHSTGASGESGDVSGRTHFYAVGRRKEAVAQVRLYPTGHGIISVNKRPISEFFKVYSLERHVRLPLVVIGHEGSVDVDASVNGGGSTGQADAVRLGIARALVQFDPALRPALRASGMLTRDPRVKERKKFGLKKARRAPQWSKR